MKMIFGTSNPIKIEDTSSGFVRRLINFKPIDTKTVFRDFIKNKKQKKGKKIG